jgi:hypothetical protein
MNGLKYIQAKQQNWAKRKGLKLFGGTIPNEGEKNYLDSITANIFNQQLSEETYKNFIEGDGSETKDSKTRLAKMKALHSSSALPVNVFQYWQNKDIYPIAYACKLCAKREVAENISEINGIAFEQKFEISTDKNLFPRSPNLDVVIENSKQGIYAIESKFTEPYYKTPEGLSERYTSDKSFWKGITHLQDLANEISPDNNGFKYLDATQLIKHILGLKNNYPKSGFTLLYLWYDVIGNDGLEHRKEIEKFAEIAKKDNIKFRHITYQEVIINLSKEFYVGNEDYINYLTDRYL